VFNPIKLNYDAYIVFPLPEIHEMSLQLEVERRLCTASPLPEVEELPVEVTLGT